MEVIKNLSGKYLKKTGGKYELTLQLSKASRFNNGFAQKFIDCQIRKRDRDIFYIERINNEKVDTHTEITTTYKTDISSISARFSSELNAQLEPL